MIAVAVPVVVVGVPVKDHGLDPCGGERAGYVGSLVIPCALGYPSHHGRHSECLVGHG